MLALAQSVPQLLSMAEAAPKPAPKKLLTPQLVRPDSVMYPGGLGDGGALGGGVGGGGLRKQAGA